MDIVVYLALAVLAAVFLFSLFILIVMCHRKYEYNRLLVAQSLRFSKLRQDNLEDIIQLGPHISQKLSTNAWVEEVSGILEDCVAVLKLCHILTDQMAKGDRSKGSKLSDCLLVITDPFLLDQPKIQRLIWSIVEEMELHHSHLLAALEQAEKLDYLSNTQEDDPASSSGAATTTNIQHQSTPVKNGGIIRISNTNCCRRSGTGRPRFYQIALAR
uniref:Transmembrane protein 98 n=1 Tax=Ditylenchus dipsaci TaxID=166011 RepID=A0A915DEQ2_9BILA